MLYRHASGKQLNCGWKNCPDRSMCSGARDLCIAASSTWSCFPGDQPVQFSNSYSCNKRFEVRLRYVKNLSWQKSQNLLNGRQKQIFTAEPFNNIFYHCGDFCFLSLGHPECIEPLVQYGADVDQHVDELGTPLQIACSNQHLSTVRKLLQLGKKASHLNFYCSKNIHSSNILSVGGRL